MAVAVIAASATTFAAPAQASEPDEVPSTLAAEPALDLDVITDSWAATETVQLAAGEVCVFSTHGDYVHVSSSANEASGHGWWENVDCPTNLADVTVQLQIKEGSTWKNIGRVGKKRVRTKSSSGQRVTGRYACVDSWHQRTWRSVIDVDLVGVIDSPNKVYTTPKFVECGP